MYTIKRNLRDFSAAHRLINGYEGKCQHLHGHNYRVCVTVGSEKLNKYGFVTDFSDIKALCDSWVQAHWDHVTLVVDSDVDLIDWLKENKMRFYLFEKQINTTAEVLAAALFNIFSKLIAEKLPGIELISVEISETENATACYSTTKLVQST